MATKDIRDMELLNPRYIRSKSAVELVNRSEEDAITLVYAAHAVYKLPRTFLIHKGKLEDYMKHLYKVPNTGKYVKKQFVRIGEGSMIYSIGHHRFIEMARAAGAVYKLGDAGGSTVLINLELFDAYMEQFRQEPKPLKDKLLLEKGE